MGNFTNHKLSLSLGNRVCSNQTLWLGSREQCEWTTQCEWAQNSEKFWLQTLDHLILYAINLTRDTVKKQVWSILLQNETFLQT